MKDSFTTQFKEVGQATTPIGKTFPFDAGLDVKSAEDILIPARGSVIIHTDLRIAVPKGFVGLLWSRSGLSTKHKLEVGAGCIDSGYTGEVLVHLYNHSDVDYQIETGDKIAQLLTIPVNLNVYEIVSDLEPSDRGTGGFGHTDRLNKPL